MNSMKIYLSFYPRLDCYLFWCRLSFATDVARGMLYLHQHKLFHGRLHSRNCVIDDRWVCKISGSNSPTRDAWAACQRTSVAPLNLLARLGLPHYLPLEITRWKKRTSGDPVAHSLTFGFQIMGWHSTERRTLEVAVTTSTVETSIVCILRQKLCWEAAPT